MKGITPIALWTACAIQENEYCMNPFKVPNSQFSLFPTSVFWSRNFFLIVRFSDHCLLVPFFKNDCAKVAGIDDFYTVVFHMPKI